ncbi:hypothetical protein FB562_0171 [Homoserinimonas aerilata]|uniref:Glutaminase n=1 Tax=Homoserinimonas aerilata TaxID=1162970 RepID=A0A542YGM1_9MICO|nr:hypothetical protein [Homoserinimonas aerilata]TQL47124.1 hypothetical protein FB562_0171 [Homoserinimonas aerilata]
MGDDTGELSASIRGSLARAAAQLTAAGASDEALAEFVPARRVALIFTREATMRPLGRVWRLGVLLLDADGNAHTVGTITRAQHTGRPNHQSVSAETRRVQRAAALKAGYPDGETVNFHTTPIDPDNPAGPLLVHDGEARVRWVAGAAPDAAAPLDAYLAERIQLLLDPPEGA